MSADTAAFECVNALLLDTTVKKATYWVSPKLVVSVCRRHRHDKRSRSHDYVLKVGAPNYAERLFLRRRGSKSGPFGLLVTRPWPKKRT